MTAVPDRPSPRAALFDLARVLPEVALDTTVRMTRVARFAGEAVLDTVTRPAPVQAALDELRTALEPSRARGAAELNALIDRLDVNAIVERVDIDALLERVDVDAIVKRVDVDAIVKRVDVDAIVNRVDIEAILDRVDIAGIVRQSTTGIGGEARDGARSAAAHGDVLVAQVVDFFLRRKQRNLDLDPS